MQTAMSRARPVTPSRQTETVRYTALVDLTIEQFVPMNGVWGDSPCIAATISPPKDISPPPYPAVPVFSGDGETIKINVPEGYDGDVRLIYRLADPRYLLLGAAFKNPDGGVGRMQFRRIGLEHTCSGSEMSVIDTCQPQWNDVNFTYVILVQEVATANIGLIDPGIQTNED
jgi:hypothetical protein